LADSQEIAKMGNWEFDLFSNKIIWSKSFYRIFGFEPYEVEPTYEMFISMVYSDDMHLIAEADKYIIDTKKPINQELRFILRDGSIRWMLNKLVPVFKDDVLVKLKGVCMDITENKQAEDKILNQVEELQRWQEVTLGREDRNIQLKQEVNELLIRLGETIRYPSLEASVKEARTALIR